jgi:low affinity Fe/Cu permease
MPNTPKDRSKTTRKFERISDKVSGVVGSPYWFIFSLVIIIVWLPSGFLLGWGEIWHLIINTTTTIMTFLMVALLHSSQSRWEVRMEKLQQRESSEIKAIEKTTKKIAYDNGKQPEKVPSEHDNAVNSLL